MDNIALSPDTVADLTKAAVSSEPDFAKLRLSQDFASGDGLVKKRLTIVPVKKPTRQTFIRVKAGESWRLNAAIVELKEDRDYYIVSNELWNELQAELQPMALFYGITKQGVPFIWPIRLPGADGKHHVAHRSALEAAEVAVSSWVRVEWKGHDTGYETLEARGSLEEPEWPELSFSEILKIAFKDKYISSLDHPVIKQLRGMV